MMTSPNGHSKDGSTTVTSDVTCDVGFSKERASRVAAMARSLLGPDRVPTPDDLCVQKLEVGLFLKAYRINEGRSLEDVVSALRRCSWLPNWIVSSAEFLQQLERLEFIGDCPLRDVYPLAEAYGMPLVMLDSLLSAPEEELLVRESFRDFVPVGSLDANRHHGIHCQYAVPRRRLRRTDAVVVHLLLESGDSVSDVHDHPGDELVFVIEGRVELQLHNMGLLEPLQAGDYAHYFAEQPHSVRNTSDQPARLMIIRFYQLLQGTRRRLMDALQSALNGIGCGNAESAARAFMEEIAPHLSQVSVLPIRKAITASKIHDPVGLGRFLRQVMRDKNYQDDDVIRLGAELGWDRTDDEIARFLRGQDVPGASHDDLNALANIMGIPTIVFANYMFPAVANCVIVRRDHDVIPIPGPAEAKGKVEYSLPCRTLAGSDIAITYLRLAPGASSPWNTHPGHELVFPLSGTIKVDVPKSRGAVEVCSRHEEYAHYVSSRTHRVSNDGEEAAELFIIRFYRLDESKTQGTDKFRHHAMTRPECLAGRVEGLPSVPFLAECAKDTKFYTNQDEE